MSEWKEMFNGTDLTGWADATNPELWSVDADGHLVGHCVKGKMSNLSTAAQYGDFELSLEYNAEPFVNSGIFMRVSDLEDPVNTGLEVQILDTFDAVPPLAMNACGALYGLMRPSVNAMNKADEWNSYLIRVQGPNVTITLNGTVVVEADLDQYTEVGVNPDGAENKFKYAWATMPRVGHIGLQSHGPVGGPEDCTENNIRFRNVKIREL